MLIRSTGRYFSAGADLKGDGGGSLPTTGSGIREMHRRLPTRMRQIWDEMEAIEKPFVVAHQARCVGGSLEMSLSCDFRLAAASAMIGRSALHGVASSDVTSYGAAAIVEREGLIIAPADGLITHIATVPPPRRNRPPQQPR